MLVFRVEEGGKEFGRGDAFDVQWRLSDKVCDFSAVREGEEGGVDEAVRYIISCLLSFLSLGKF